MLSDSLSLQLSVLSDSLLPQLSVLSDTSFLQLPVLLLLLMMIQICYPAVAFPVLISRHQ